MGYHDTVLSAPSCELSGSSDSESQDDTAFASASAIRKYALSFSRQNLFPQNLSGQIPSEAFPVFEKALLQQHILTEDAFDPVLGYCILRKDAQELSDYLDISDSLAQRIVNCRNSFEGFSQFASLLKTREITQTRIQRALLHLILEIHSAPSEIPYARVLGFRKESSALLKNIKSNSRIPVITKLADAKKSLHPQALSLLSETTFASNLYQTLLSQKSRVPFVHEYQQKIVII